MKFAPRPSLLCVVLVAVAACACSHKELLVSRPAAPPKAFVIHGVRVFDSPRAALLGGSFDVSITGGRIASIAPAGAAKTGEGDIDGAGATLLPGLVDVHTHTASTPAPIGATGALPDVDANMAAFLYAGVTTVLDLGNLTPAVFRQRDGVRNGSSLGPHLYAAGPVFTAPGGHPAEVLREFLPWYLRWYVLPRATREVATAAEAKKAVEELVPSHPDILKIAIDAGAGGDVPGLDAATLAAITATGHAAAVRSIAHIGDSSEALLAVQGGVDALAHEPWREEISDEAVRAIAAAHVPVVVTLSIWDLIGTPRKTAEEFLPIERAVTTPEMIAALLAPPLDNPGIRDTMTKASAATQARRRSVAKLRAAGVVVLAGSDGCNAGQFPGAGLHRELRALVGAGMTPGEALRAATFENARFLAGEHADFGEIAAAKRADLVLVDGDPTTDLTALGNIRAVILDGVPLARR